MLTKLFNSQNGRFLRFQSSISSTEWLHLKWKRTSLIHTGVLFLSQKRNLSKGKAAKRKRNHGEIGENHFRKRSFQSVIEMILVEWIQRRKAAKREGWLFTFHQQDQCPQLSCDETISRMTMCLSWFKKLESPFPTLHCHKQGGNTSIIEEV